MSDQTTEHPAPEYVCTACGRTYACASAADTCADIDTGHAWEDD